MDKRQIIKYISGRSAADESRAVLDWIEKSDGNRAYYNQLKNLWVASNMPEDRACKEDWNDLHRRMNGNGRSIKEAMRVFQKIAAVLFIPLICALIYLYLNNRDAATGAEQYITYYANKGIKSRLSLPDGTKVWLNSDSYLKCPQKFTADQRDVYLSGEAFFEVVKNDEKPFVVHAGNNVRLLVTGTSFNVSSYKDDNMVYATLVSGSVDFIVTDLEGATSEIVKMNANDFVSYYSINGELKKSRIDTYITTSWRKGWLCFENAPLRDVLKKLSRWYGVNFVIKSPELADISLTAKFSNESISQVMELIKRSTIVDYAISDDFVTVFVRK